MFTNNNFGLLYDLYNTNANTNTNNGSVSASASASNSSSLSSSTQINIRGVTLNSDHVLTDDQTKCLERIASYFHEPFQKGKFITMSGPAGCGKTTLLKLVVVYNNSLGPNRKQILGCALTHKARKVLDQTINQNNFVKIPTVTVASLLKKEKKAGYVGTKKYRSTGNRLKDYHVVLVDEVSMLTDKDTTDIIRYADMYQIKVIFIGDNYQIPHPIQDFIIYENKLEKKDNIAFNPNIAEQCRLNEVVRQGKENPLSEICLKIRENLRNNGVYLKTDTMTSKDTDCNTNVNTNINTIIKGVEFYTDKVEFIDTIVAHYLQHSDNYQELLRTKVICYTNEAVREYNKIIRSILYQIQTKQDVFHKNDILMGYENVGYPTLFIENSQEYLVKSSNYITNYSIPYKNYKNHNLVGHVLEIQEISSINPMTPNSGITPNNGFTSSSGGITSIFLPDIYSPNNYEILSELVKKAEKVNKPRSTITDFKEYQELKEKLIFIEALYKIGDEILGEHDFQLKHPILFTRVTDVIKETTEEILMPNQESIKISCKRNIIPSDYHDELEKLFPGLVKDRIADTNVLGDSEEFKDKFQIITKDIDYGYAITGHKSQGSTYNRVFIDEVDFNKIQDRWNPKHAMMVRGSKERNQLKYVAFSRARYLASVYTG